MTDIKGQPACIRACTVRCSNYIHVWKLPLQSRRSLPSSPAPKVKANLCNVLATPLICLAWRMYERAKRRGPEHTDQILNSGSRARSVDLYEAHASTCQLKTHVTDTHKHIEIVHLHFYTAWILRYKIWLDKSFGQIVSVSCLNFRNSLTCSNVIISVQDATLIL